MYMYILLLCLQHVYDFEVPPSIRVTPLNVKIAYVRKENCASPNKNPTHILVSVRCVLLIEHIYIYMYVYMLPSSMNSPR